MARGGTVRMRSHGLTATFLLRFQSCLERMEKAERVVPKMQATIEFVSGYVRQQVEQLDLTPPASFAMHAKLIPSY
jgi:hypothetical protein